MLILRKLLCADREGGSKASSTRFLPQYLLQWKKKKKLFSGFIPGDYFIIQY